MSASPQSERAPKAKNKGPSIHDVLSLYLKNLQAMREWYRASPARGVEVGHIQVAEIALADNSLALRLALEGKAWSPPELPEL